MSFRHVTRGSPAPIFGSPKAAQSSADSCDGTMAAPRSNLIFDLDGTLIDSAPDLATALNALLAELDCPPLALEQVRRLVGDGAPTLVARALQTAGASFEPETYESLLERYRAIYLAMRRRRPGSIPRCPRRSTV